MTTDRELLELAAKAAGMAVEYWAQDDYPVVRDGAARVGWNPLVFDSDALRLVVKLGLDFYEGDDDGRAAYVGYYERRENTKPPRFMIERHDAHGDPYAATRRAIVRAAAAIGASA